MCSDKFFLQHDLTVWRFLYRRIIEFPSVTVCNLNIMKVSRLSEDPKYQNLGGIDLQTKKKVHQLLGALHLEETLKRPVYPGDQSAETEALRGQRELGLTGDEETSEKTSLHIERTQGSSHNGTGVSAADDRDVNGETMERDEARSNATTTSDTLHRNRKHVDDRRPEGGTNDFRYQANNFASVASDYEFDALMAHSLTADFSDLFDLLKPTSEDLEKYGHRAKDLIVQCSIDSRNCSYRYRGTS